MQPPSRIALLDRNAVVATVDYLVSVQLPDGCIPWFPGGHADPWNHVEAAMALSSGGRIAEADLAYRWLARMQRADGTWAAAYREGEVVDPTVDANICAYIAAGLWHHTMATGDAALLTELWPVVDGAIESVLPLQAPDGEFFWARDEKGRAWPGALLTSSSCIHLSLRCADRAAAELGLERDHWKTAADRLAHAVTHRPECFEPKDNWSMDWYYPVLGGATTGLSARARLAERWDEFVVDGLGARCVLDRPWVTAAETCELALALDAIGQVDQAWRLFDWIQHCRYSDGAYWTGWVYDDEAHWPEERPTWTSAAVVLAADALFELSPATGFFRALHEDDGLLESVGDSA